ncbi:hypothetical protein ACFQZT_31200 [Paenibacillus sp. GCM10027628]|uniref:hypothetical protein n=1 Tax=Paenibacillus sp. GCM10027628 TaxID=3273413 RepID=UPI003625E1FB
MLLTKKKVSIGLLTLALLAGGTSYYSLVYNKVTTIVGYERVVPYNDLQSLEKNAEIILIATPTNDFEGRDHKATYFPGGKSSNTIQDAYTLTNIKVQKVIKSNGEVSEDKTIKVIEPVGLIQEITGKKKLTVDDYSEMEKGKKYVVFLKKNTQGQYSIMSSAYGKYNLDNADTKDTTDIQNRENIKKEIKSKYQ